MEITLNVGGMTCQGCVRSVKKALESFPASTGSSSLERGQAMVSFDPAQTGVDAFKDAIAAAGYEPSLDNS